MKLVIERLKSEEAQRQKQQGLGRPIIATEFEGYRIVAVGGKFHYSKSWRTFHDFLRDFMFIVFGRDWFTSQAKLPANEQHQILRWLDQSNKDAKGLGVNSDGFYTGPMTGAQRAFLNLSYNLYLIAHHSQPSRAAEILDTFVDRLKSSVPSDFIGKLFETYASAAFLKAGFLIDYENEKDGRDSHVEFTATFPKTGRKFAVEVKTRNRTIGADGPVDEVKRLRVASKLCAALRKSSPHDRVVFIEVNVPDVVGDHRHGTWVEAALDQIKDAESLRDALNRPFPPAYVIVTNHAFHNNLNASGIGLQAVADGYLIPDFGPGATVGRFAEYLKNLDRHKEILALFDSIREHSHIPITFDGENPEFAFGEDKEMPRLIVGNEYVIPDGKGGTTVGVLEQGLVMESWGNAQCVYRLRDNRSVIVSHELTEREWRAWRLHPETFFGRIEEARKEPENWLEFAHFMYESYKKSTKDKLLEFMAGSQDFAELSQMSQEELAIIYCERMAWSFWQSHGAPEKENGSK
ncbi:MAG: hypothetical protein ACK47C_19925 [Paracoccaceae bacterium]